VLGNAQAAATAFRQAAAIYPDAQAPRLGMSQLALDRGDRAAALEAFQAGVASAPNRGAIDPRLAYDHAHAPGTDELLDELRRTFSR
jgi:hypothetical protein